MVLWRKNSLHEWVAVELLRQEGVCLREHLVIAPIVSVKRVGASELLLGLLLRVKYWLGKHLVLVIHKILALAAFVKGVLFIHEISAGLIRIERCDRVEERTCTIQAIK